MSEQEQTREMTIPGNGAGFRPPVVAGGRVAALVPQNLDEAWRLSEAFARGGVGLPRGISQPGQVMLIICGGAEVGFGPFQSLQSFYLVNNRLTMWGDAIPALLWSNGFKLKEWYENSDPAYPDNMIAKCLVTRPDGTEIEGEFSVADAKEAKLWTKDGPWQTARKRMLKMRARAFAARDGAPDVLRGIAIREEVEDYDLIDGVKSDPAPLHSGFKDGEAPALTAPRKPRKKAAEEEPNAAASWALAAASDGQPQPGEVYLHAEGSVLLEGGEKRMTFKDGVRFSAVGAEGAQALFVYAEHAPELPACEECGMTEGHMADCPNAEEEGEPENPTSEEADTGTDGAQDAESEPDTSEPATDASGDGAETSASGPSAEAEGEGDEPPLPPEFAAYGETVDGATDFTTIKGALKAFMATATFKGFNEEQANGVRRSTWEAMKENFFPGDLPDPFADVSAFRLWVEAQDDAEALKTGLSRLEEHPDFKGKPDALKEALRGAVAARTAVLEEEG